jgi:hypothetical protein
LGASRHGSFSIYGSVRNRRSAVCSKNNDAEKIKERPSSSNDLEVTDDDNLEISLVTVNPIGGRLITASAFLVVAKLVSMWLGAPGGSWSLEFQNTVEDVLPIIGISSFLPVMFIIFTCFAASSSFEHVAVSAWKKDAVRVLKCLRVERES